jgi:hypothetical protein
MQFRSHAEGEEAPLARNTLQSVFTLVREFKTGTGHEVCYGAGYQNLTCLCIGCDTGRDVNRDPSDVVSPDLDLTGVESDPNLYTERIENRPQATATADTPARSVKSGEHAITCGLDVSATKSLYLPSQQGVVLVENLTPPAVAQRCCLFCRGDDVGEQDGGEHPIRCGDLPLAGQERLDLIGELISVK